MSVSDQESFEERLVTAFATLRNWLYVLSAAVIILLGVSIYGFTKAMDVSHRQTRDEQTTCAIQSRGLPAGHALAGVVADIAKLLELGGSFQQKAHPTAQQLTAIKELVQLRNDAQKYTQLELSQPRGRSC